MKQQLRRIILFIAAISVFTTGMGVNLVQYCCSNCKSEANIFQQHFCADVADVELALEEETSCCGKGHVGQEASDCDLDKIAEKCSKCSVTRLSIDLDSSISKPNVFVQTVLLTDLPILTTSLLLDKKEYLLQFLTNPDPPKISPREYLSLIRILII